MTQALTNMNIITINALANFAIFSTSKNKMTKAMAKQVMTIVTTGVK
jgi:predicted xylose isomerase-like sugar epimerase